MRLIDADKLKQLREDVISGKVDIQTEGDLIDACPTANPYEWISVEDRLPEEKINYLVHYKHAYCDNDGYWAIGITFYDGSKFQIDWMYKVTHWMPLPEPPIEKEN